MTQAIHTLDLLPGFTGLPDRVTGLAGTSAVHRMECEDMAAALLHFPGGAIGVVQATTAASPGYTERIELNGNLGTATLEAGELRVQFTDGRNVNVGAPRALGAEALVASTTPSAGMPP